jgi:SAM-dependent methyltransferase
MNILKEKMKSNGYIEWKKWSEDKFAWVMPGSRFHFDQIFSGRFKNKSKILEIGFGNGELLSYFRELGHQVIGVEINNDLVVRAKKSGFTAYSGLIWEIPELQSEKFDLLVALAVAEHMHYKELVEFFSWANLHLNNGGTIHLKFPEGASPFGLGYQHGDFTHVSCLTKSKIEALCEASNMKLISYTDEPLVSNKLCSIGFPGKVCLYILQAYSGLFKWLILKLLYPVCPTLRLSTNSIAVISIARP